MTSEQVPNFLLILGSVTLKSPVSNSDAESEDDEIDGNDDTVADILPDDLDEDKILNSPSDIPTSTTSATNLLKRKSDNQVSSSSESLSQVSSFVHLS